MNDETFSTAPKPFIFVLMPFDEKFDDIYKFGIKGAAEEAGAYAERVDEQIFTEGILERIFNQINKADLIVADMTGRNPNVFYEVGYAHSLGKIVLLLTQDVDDIPFDLKHRQHIVYGNKIQYLRKELSSKLSWAINESRGKRKEKDSKCISISLSNLIQMSRGINSKLEEKINFPEIQEDNLSNQIHSVKVINKYYYKRLYPSLDSHIYSTFLFQVHNISSEEIPIIKHIYLFTSDDPILEPWSAFSSDVERSGCTLVYNPEKDSKYPRKYILPITIPPVPAGAVETFTLRFVVSNPNVMSDIYKLRIHTSNNYYDFSFIIEDFEKILPCSI